MPGRCCEGEPPLVSKPAVIGNEHDVDRSAAMAYAERAVGGCKEAVHVEAQTGSVERKKILDGVGGGRWRGCGRGRHRRVDAQAAEERWVFALAMLLEINSEPLYCPVGVGEIDHRKLAGHVVAAPALTEDVEQRAR